MPLGDENHVIGLFRIDILYFHPRYETSARLVEAWLENYEVYPSRLPFLTGTIFPFEDHPERAKAPLYPVKSLGASKSTHGSALAVSVHLSAGKSGSPGYLL